MKLWSIVLAIGVVVAAPVAKARCDKPPRFLTEEYLRRWEIIAYGLVTEVHDHSASPQKSFAVLTLEGAWQGNPPNPLTVYHSDTVHGYQFAEGASYLVFASRSEGRIVASICGPTCREAECLSQLELLGPPAVRY